MNPLDPLDANLDRIRRALLASPQRTPTAIPADGSNALDRSLLIQRLMFWRSR